MTRKMKKFADGGSDRYKARYERKTKDIESDYQKALKSGKDKEVAKAKMAQRMADAKDDLAKRTGADRTATRAGERAAESALSSARRVSRAAPGTSRTSVMDSMAAKNAEPIKTSTDTSTLKKPSIARPGASFKEAFAAARKTGDKTFSWNGKSFSTAVKGEGRTAPARRAAAAPMKKDAKPSAPAKAADKPVAARAAPPKAENKPMSAGKLTGPMKEGFVRTGSPGSGSILPPKPKAPDRTREVVAGAGPLGALAMSGAEAMRNKRLEDEALRKRLANTKWPAGRAPSGVMAAAKAKGGAIKGYAKGGKIDGCAVRGKTRAKKR